MSETKYFYITDVVRLCRADERNLEVQYKRTVKSKPNRYQSEYKETEKWTFGGYHSNLEMALRSVLTKVTDYSIGDGEVSDMNEVLSAMEKCKKSITDSVTKLGLTLESFPKNEDNRGRKKE